MKDDPLHHAADPENLGWRRSPWTCAWRSCARRHAWQRSYRTLELHSWWLPFACSEHNACGRSRSTKTNWTVKVSTTSATVTATKHAAMSRSNVIASTYRHHRIWKPLAVFWRSSRLNLTANTLDSHNTKPALLSTNTTRMSQQKTICYAFKHKHYSYKI